MCKSFIVGNAYEGYTEEALISKGSIRPGWMSDTCERRGGKKKDGVDMVQF